MGPSAASTSRITPYYVDLCIAVADGRILGHYRYPAFALEIVRVHDSLDDLLVFPVYTGLLEHLVHKRRLAVVDVGYDRNISQFIHLFVILSENLKKQQDFTTTCVCLQ